VTPRREQAELPYQLAVCVHLIRAIDAGRHLERQGKSPFWIAAVPGLNASPLDASTKASAMAQLD
jgi:hypothetical protein